MNVIDIKPYETQYKCMDTGMVCQGPNVLATSLETAHAVAELLIARGDCHPNLKVIGEIVTNNPV